MTINITPNFLYEISDSLFQYRDVFKYYFPTYIVDYDDSIVAHATYLAQKAAGGFHDLKFNVTKSSYWIHHEFDWIVDPWYPYYRTGVLPLFFHYLNIHEIIQLMPGSAQLKINRNQLLDVARLIQFFETTRFIEATYMNLGHSFKEHQAFFIVITPAEILLYDLQERLVAQLDFVKSKISYVGRQTTEFNNFYNYLKDLAFRFTRFMPVGYAKNIDNMVRPDWMRMNAQALNQPWNYLRKIKRSKFSHANLAHLKKEYMKKYGLDYNDPEVYASFNFRVVTLANPFWFKWGNKKIALKQNVPFNSLPKNAAVELLNNKRLNLDNYNTPLLFKEAFKLIEDISNLARAQHTKKRYQTKEYKNAYWNTVVDSLYLKHYVSWENDITEKQSIIDVFLPSGMSMAAHYLRRFGFKDDHTKYKKQSRRSLKRFRGRKKLPFAFFWKRAGEQSLWMDQMMLEDHMEDKEKWLGTRFLVRNKAEFWWNHTEQDTAYLNKMLNWIEKRAQAIDAFDKDKKIATDHWYVQERNYHLEYLHKLINFYIRAHTTYIKSKTSDFFIEILTMDGLSLDRKLGLCEMYLDQIRLFVKKTNNYLLYKTEYEPAKMLYAKILGAKNHFGVASFEARNKNFKKPNNEIGFLNVKGQNLYFEDLYYGKFNESAKSALFDYFLEFKDLMQDLFIIKTFKKNGKNVKILYPRYTNKFGEGLGYSKNKPFSKQLDFFHKKLLSFLETTKQDMEGTVQEFKNNYDLLVSPKNGFNGFNTPATSKKLGNYWQKNFVASLFDSWGGTFFKYRWFQKKRTRDRRRYFKLRWFRIGNLAANHIRRKRVSGGHQRSTWHSVADFHANKHVFIQNQKALLDWATIKWNNETAMHDPGMLTNYEDLGLDIKFDLEFSQKYDDFFDEEAVREETESSTMMAYEETLKQEALDKARDLNTLLSLLDESKIVIDKLKHDTAWDQREVVNFDSEYQYEEEDLSTLFDSRYFQTLIASFVWGEDVQEKELNTFLPNAHYDLFETSLEDIVDLVDIDKFALLLNDQQPLLHEKDKHFINNQINPYLENVSFIEYDEVDVKEIKDTIQAVISLNNENSSPLTELVKYFSQSNLTKDLEIPVIRLSNKELLYSNLFEFFFKLHKKTFPYKNSIQNFYSLDQNSSINKYIADAKIKNIFNFLDTDGYILNKINNVNDSFLLNYLRYIKVDPWFTKYLPIVHKSTYPQDFMSSDSSSEENFMDSLVYTLTLKQPEKTKVTQEELMDLLNSRTLEERKKASGYQQPIDSGDGWSSDDDNDYDYLYLEEENDLELNFLKDYGNKLTILYKLFRYLYFAKHPEAPFDYRRNLFREEIKFDKYYNTLYNKNLIGAFDWKQLFNLAISHNISLNRVFEYNVDSYDDASLLDRWEDFTPQHSDSYWTIKHFMMTNRYLKDNYQVLKKLLNNTPLKSYLLDIENQHVLDSTSKLTRNFESNIFNKIKSNRILSVNNPTYHLSIKNFEKLIEKISRLNDIVYSKNKHWIKSKNLIRYVFKNVNWLYKQKKIINKEIYEKFLSNFAYIINKRVFKDNKRSISFSQNHALSNQIRSNKYILTTNKLTNSFDTICDDLDDDYYDVGYDYVNKYYERGESYKHLIAAPLDTLIAEGLNKNLKMLTAEPKTQTAVWHARYYLSILFNMGCFEAGIFRRDFYRFPWKRLMRKIVIHFLRKWRGSSWEKLPLSLVWPRGKAIAYAVPEDKDIRFILKVFKHWIPEQRAVIKRYYKQSFYHNNTSLYDENSIMSPLLSVNQIENNFNFLHLINSINLLNTENLNDFDTTYISNPFYSRLFEEPTRIAVADKVFIHQSISELLTNRNELKSLAYLQNFKNPRMFKLWDITKIQSLVKKYFSMLNNSTVIKNNVNNLEIKRFSNYTEFPLWINNVLMNEKKSKIKNKSYQVNNNHFLIGRLINKLKYYNKHKDNISKENLKDFEETYAKVLKLTKGLLSEFSMSRSNSTIFRKKDKTSELFPNFEKVVDPNVIIYNQAAKVASKKNPEFYTPEHSKYFHSVILNEYRHFPYSKFIPEWLDLYQFEDFILSLMQTDQDFNKLYLLKVLQKQYDDEFIQPLLMAIVDRMQYSQTDKLIKETVSKSSMWRRFFTKPVMKGSTPFQMAISSINNSLLRELYSISLMKEDTYIGNQYESFPKITEMNDVNFSSISLNPIFFKLGPVLGALTDMDEHSLNFKHIRYLKFKMILNLMFKQHFDSKLKNNLNFKYLKNQNVEVNSSFDSGKINFNSEYPGVFVDSNMVNIDPKFDKYLHLMSLKGKDYQILRNDKDQKIVSEDTTYFSSNVFSFVKRLFEGWRSWSNFIK